MPKGYSDLDLRSKLLDEAKRLAPIFRSRSADTEKLRRMPNETIADIQASGITRMCQPKRFGGAELPWDALVEIDFELGKGCGSQTWVANVFVEHNCHLAHFPDEAQHDVWDENPAALISTSYAPVGKAEKVDGGWKLSGRWGFSSGVDHSTWSLLGAMVANDAGELGQTFFLIPKKDRQVLDTWFTLGLTGTGSNDVVLEDVFVPAHRVLDSRDSAIGKSPGAEVNTNPLYKMPHIGFAQPALAGVTVGVAAGAVDDFEEMLRTRKVRGKPLADLQNMQLRLAEASAEVEAARLLCVSTAKENMAIVNAGNVLGLTDLGRSRRNAAYAVKLAKSATQRIFEATGANGIYEAAQIQRAFRDVQAAASHIALGWDLSGMIYAREALGRDLSEVL
jgi:alkylation response protein AidB-like acyl-CoA dehydrogenase